MKLKLARTAASTKGRDLARDVLDVPAPAAIWTLVYLKDPGTGAALGADLLRASGGVACLICRIRWRSSSYAHAWKSTGVRSERDFMEFLRRVFKARRPSEARSDEAPSDEVLSEETALAKELATLDREEPGWDRAARLAGAEGGLRAGMSFELVSKVYGEELASEARARSSPNQAPAVTGASGPVLVVEGDVPVREVVVRAMRSRGLEVLTATNAEEAMAQALRVALVLTDLERTTVGGFDLIGRLLRVHPNLRVVTMRGSREAQRQAKADGAFDCLVADDFTNARIAETLERLRR